MAAQPPNNLPPPLDEGPDALPTPRPLISGPTDYPEPADTSTPPEPEAPPEQAEAEEVQDATETLGAAEPDSQEAAEARDTLADTGAEDADADADAWTPLDEADMPPSLEATDVPAQSVDAGHAGPDAGADVGRSDVESAPAAPPPPDEPDTPTPAADEGTPDAGIMPTAGPAEAPPMDAGPPAPTDQYADTAPGIGMEDFSMPPQPDQPDAALAMPDATEPISDTIAGEGFVDESGQMPAQPEAPPVESGQTPDATAPETLNGDIPDVPPPVQETADIGNEVWAMQMQSAYTADASPSSQAQGQTAEQIAAAEPHDDPSAQPGAPDGEQPIDLLGPEEGKRASAEEHGGLDEIKQQYAELRQQYDRIEQFMVALQPILTELSQQTGIMQ